MSTKNGETTVRRESFLSNAWSNLRPARPPAVRTPGNDEYFSIGRQSNAALIEQRQDEGLFSLVRGNDTLEELLDIPYALAHIKDLHAAMQLAVVSMGEEREDLIASSLFFPVFGAFALGFSIGLVTAHRARHAATYQGLETLPKEDQQQCRDGQTVGRHCPYAHACGCGRPASSSPRQPHGDQEPCDAREPRKP